MRRGILGMAAPQKAPFIYSEISPRYSHVGRFLDRKILMETYSGHLYCRPDICLRPSPNRSASRDAHNNTTPECCRRADFGFDVVVLEGLLKFPKNNNSSTERSFGGLGAGAAQEKAGELGGGSPPEVPKKLKLYG